MTDHESNSQGAFERNRQAFNDDLERLLTAHEGKYALMHDAKVAGTFDSMRNAYEFGRRRFRLQPIYIGHIVREPDIVYMPTLVQTASGGLRLAF
jgi:hypothetical protein